MHVSAQARPAVIPSFSITGHVYDQKGHPLEFATIMIPDLNTGTHSDHEGAFTLPPFMMADTSVPVEIRFVNNVTVSRKLTRKDLGQPLKYTWRILA